MKIRIQWNRVILAFIAGFVVLEAGLAFGRKWALEREVHRNLLKAQSDLVTLQNDNVRLRKEKEALYRPQKIEELAREKLGLTKPHEIAVKIIRQPQDAPEQQGKGTAPSKNWWQKLKEEFSVKWLLKSGPS